MQYCTLACLHVSSYNGLALVEEGQVLTIGIHFNIVLLGSARNSLFKDQYPYRISVRLICSHVSCNMLVSSLPLCSASTATSGDHRSKRISDVCSARCLMSSRNEDFLTHSDVMREEGKALYAWFLLQLKVAASMTPLSRQLDPTAD